MKKWNIYEKLCDIIKLKVTYIIDKIFKSLMFNYWTLYLKLKSESPEIEKLIPLYHIASYLNVTPVQLSRIRRD